MKDAIYLEDAVKGYEIVVSRKEYLNGAVVIDGKIVLDRGEVKRLVKFLSEDLEDLND